MTRGKPPATGRPCLTCGVPHTYNHDTGWRADNGHGPHGYLQGDEYPPLKAVPQPSTSTTTQRLTAPVPADFTVIFGNWAECRRCGTLTSNTAAGMASHRALHAELDQLRADIDRLTRRSGGGAA